MPNTAFRSAARNTTRILSLFLLALSVQAQETDSQPPGAPGPSVRGYNPGVAYVDQAEVKVSQPAMDLLATLPVTPSYKAADNLEYGVKLQYNSNILNYYLGTSDLPFSSIPTYKSPFGVGFEGFGVVYEMFHSGGPLGYSVQRTWVYQSPDGAVHPLHLLKTATVTGDQPAAPVLGESLAAKGLNGGNTIFQQSGGVTSELNSESWVYASLDGSEIRAYYHAAAGGNPAWWELRLKNGQIIEFKQGHFPAGQKSVEDYASSNKDGGCPGTPTADVLVSTKFPQQFLGYFPTKVRNRSGAYYTLAYENSAFPYIVTRISSGTSRVNGDLIFTVDGTGHYTAVEYPAADGVRHSVTFSYHPTRYIWLRDASGAQVGAATIPVTLLKDVTFANGYKLSFQYYDETSTAPNHLAAGRWQQVTMTTGSVHTFTYAVMSTPGGNTQLAVATHTLARFPGAIGKDLQTWTNTQGTISGNRLPNVVTDPAGNSTVYYLFTTSDDFNGLVDKVEKYQGAYTSPSKVLRYVERYTYASQGVQPRPLAHSNMQLTRLVREYSDDRNADGTALPAASQLVVDRSGWDGWGHFAAQSYSGTLAPKARRYVTTWSVDPSKTLFNSGLAASANTYAFRWPLCNGALGARTSSAYYATPAVQNCQPFADYLSQWDLSLPVRVEEQEEISRDLYNNPVYGTVRRTDTRYDAATALPVRQVRRFNPAAAPEAVCGASYPTASSGDVVTDLYYDAHGNLALQKASGADEAAVFRTYFGYGTQPGAQTAPGSSAATGPDGAESIYAESGSYFGIRRWSRSYTSPGEGAVHQYLDSWVDGADIDPASGTFLKSRDAQGMAMRYKFDALGRQIEQQFQNDIMVQTGWIDAGGKPAGRQTLQDDPAAPIQKSESQDYFDGTGRKIITRRRNADGRVVYQATHYDEMGNADYVSNWTTAVPPGLANPLAPDPSQWSESALKTFITVTVGQYQRNCYRVSPNGANNWQCDDAATYDYLGRVRRVEKWSSPAVRATAVDTEYFGLNTRTITHGIQTGAGTTADSITVRYYDAFGNLRVVDSDAGVTSGQQGADAIYDYNHANQLTRSNLVPQVTLAPTNLNRLAVASIDHQVRSFTFDALGRERERRQPETGILKSLRYNALGAVTEYQDENGRNGGAPWNPVFSETVPAMSGAPCVCLDYGPPCYEWQCPISLQSNGFFSRNRELSCQWAATGKGKSGATTYPIPGSTLYYRVLLDGVEILPWTLGLASYQLADIAPGSHTLTVEANYTGAGDPALTSISNPFSAADYAAAYTIRNGYDARGRLVAVAKHPVAGGADSTLRSFSYESGADCLATLSCGRLAQTQATAWAGTIVQDFDYNRPADGRLNWVKVTVPMLTATRGYTTTFDYDNFGRDRRLAEPLPSGAADTAHPLQKNYQYGGLASLVRITDINTGASSPYATMSASGDYWTDGSLARFVQGNGVTGTRTPDGLNRLAAIDYLNGVTPVWQSGSYIYDGAGNITAIGSDLFYYDRMNRLTYSKVNRHPHQVAGQNQATGYITLNYGYDAFGNITKRNDDAAASVNYKTSSDPTVELFTARDYVNGVSGPDNKIQATGFSYDGNGNLLSDSRRDFVYDALNQQIEARIAAPIYATGTLIQRAGYAADGMRALRETFAVDASSIRTAYSRNGKYSDVITEHTEALNSGSYQTERQRKYIYSPWGTLATETTCWFGCNADETVGLSTIRYYELDHFGTTRAISNASGVLETSFEVEPYGLKMISSNPSYQWWSDNSSATHWFTNHERDAECNEDYMKFRMYSLATARFAQQDPMFGGTDNTSNWNTYGYVNGNPIMYWDPMGAQKSDDPCKTNPNGTECACQDPESDACANACAVTPSGKGCPPPSPADPDFPDWCSNNPTECERYIQQNPAAAGMALMTCTTGEKGSTTSLMEKSNNDFLHGCIDGVRPVGPVSAGIEVTDWFDPKYWGEKAINCMEGGVLASLQDNKEYNNKAEKCTLIRKYIMHTR